MDYFVGEIRVFPFNFAPQGWHLCDGTILPVNGNVALYSLIGNTYGGTAPNTFALPDLRGKVPVTQGNLTSNPNNPVNYTMGLLGGAENVTLNLTQIPAHNHSFCVKNGTGTNNEPNDIVAIPQASGQTGALFNVYNSNIGTSVALNANSIASVGGNANHNNMQPFLVLNFCISLTGLYPTRP